MCESYQVSVIVPVYNASGTLVRCIESLLMQNMSLIEIILVDDGSTDRSGDICDEYALKNARICVVHQENRGALSARVMGCKIAKGKYISFVDSDDWVDNNMFEELCSKIKDADMLASGVYRNAFDGRLMGRSLNTLDDGFYDLSDDNIMNSFFFPTHYVSGEYPGAILGGPWGKLFLRERVLKFIDYLNVRIREYEDWLFNVIYILHSKKLRVVRECYYHYSSTINSVKYSANLDFLSEQNLVYKIIKQFISGHVSEAMILKQIQKRFMYNIMSEIGVKLEFYDEVLIPRWHFPQNNNLIGKRIILFGAGSIGQSYLMDWKKRKIEVVQWIDNVPGNSEMFGLIPQKPTTIIGLDFDYVVCGVKGERAFKSMMEQLLRLGIEEQKILWDKPIYTWVEYFCD